jgi:hypothetical protein
MPHPAKRKGDALTQAEKTRNRRARNRAKPFDPSAEWHGTTNGYTNHCCHCDRCRAAYRAYSNVWRKQPHVAERIRVRSRELAKRPDQVLKRKAAQYGIDVETLSAHMEERVCFACGASDVDLAVDHDHSCCPGFRRACGDCVRGLLCRNCNQTLGLVGDSIERLHALIAYLERWEERRASI